MARPAVKRAQATPGNGDSQPVASKASGRQSEWLALLSTLSPLYQAKDAHECLAGLVAACSKLLAPYQVFGVLCEEATGEPDLDSLYAQPEADPELRAALQRHLNGVLSDGGPNFWIVHVIHESRHEALLGAVCLPTPADTASEQFETVRLLARISARFLAGLRDAQRLRRKVDDLESLLEVNSHILSNVCHEFRSTLTAVRGYTKRVLEERSGPINDAQREDLAVVQKNTRRLLDLASHSLPFVAEQRLRVESFDLREVWQQVTRRMRFRLSEKALALQDQTPPGPVIINADRARLGTVFEIILANAINCASEGREINVRVSHGPDGEVTAKVLVPGAMLPAQVLDRIFEHQDEPSVPETGADRPRVVGLSLAHDLVWLHGGRLAVRTMAEEGTMFAITLPGPVTNSWSQ